MLNYTMSLEEQKYFIVAIALVYGLLLGLITLVYLKTKDDDEPISKKDWRNHVNPKK